MHLIWRKRRAWRWRKSRCGHKGPGRIMYRGRIGISTRGHDGKNRTLISIPEVGSCCLRSPEARKKWWEDVDQRIEHVRRMKDQRSQDPALDAAIAKNRGGWDRQLDKVVKDLERRVRRVRSDASERLMERMRLRSEKVAQQAAEVAKAMQEQAMLDALLVSSPSWDIVGVPPRAPARMVMTALAEKKERLRREGASLEAFRELQAAGMDCLRMLKDGTW
jgi:hypothetical protein